MPRVCIDAGHGGADPGALGAGGQPEKASNLRVALRVEALLAEGGFEVLMTRRDDREVSLAERCRQANRWGADVLVSLHADVSSSSSTRGHHAIHSIHAQPGEGGHKLARLLVDRVTEATSRSPFPRGDRGTWSRPSETTPGVDYYAVIRETGMPAVLLERGFLSNVEDTMLLFDDVFLGLQARGIARGIEAFFSLAGEEPPGPGASGTAILDQAKIPVVQARLFFERVTGVRIEADVVGNGTHARRVKYPPERVREIIDGYWIAGREEGVRPEVAFAQSMHETAYLTFERPDGSPGDVQAEQLNFCGLGATGDGEPGLSFPSVAAGVRAHLRHLRLYAEQDRELARRLNDRSVDPRGLPEHLLGSARVVEQLGGRWSPDPDYGRRIVRDVLEPLLAARPPASPFRDVPPGHWALPYLWRAAREKVLYGPDAEPDRPATRAEVLAMIYRALDAGNPAQGSEEATRGH